ncbi:hypothetical protein OC834_003829 [Tilletia horrida]|nr:hypothetical protein OC834_003829 [Tilletia horrida]
MSDNLNPSAARLQGNLPELPTLEHVVSLIQATRAENAVVVARVATLEREVRGLELRHNVLNRIISGLIAEREEHDGGLGDGPATGALGPVTTAPSGEDAASPSASDRRPARHSSEGTVTPVRNWRRSSSDATEADSESSHVAHVVSSFQAQHPQHTDEGGNIDAGPDDQSPFVCPFCP